MTRRVALTPRCGDYAVNCIKTYINSIRALSALAVCIKRAYRTFQTTRLKFIWLFCAAHAATKSVQEAYNYTALKLLFKVFLRSRPVTLDMHLKKTFRFWFCTIRALTVKFAKRKLICFMKWATESVPLQTKTGKKQRWEFHKVMWIMTRNLLHIFESCAN